jgi:hypothetical protein
VLDSTSLIKVYRLFFVLITVLNIVLFVPFVSAEDVTWVTVEGTASMEHTVKKKARARAIEDAVQKAVEKAVAAELSVETLVVNLRLSGGLATAIPYGRVVDKKIIEEGVVNIHTEGEDKASVVYRVRMKAGVVEETTGVDNSFRIESSLNRPGFKDGDEMKLKIRSTKDCYIAVFIIAEDEKVIRLIPNRYKKDNFLKSGNTFSFPDVNVTEKGIKLRAHVPEKKDAVTETVYVFALKRPFTFDTARFQEGVYGSYNGRTAFVNELIKEIVRIPLSERAEQLIQYQISKDKRGGK